jgi:glycosyltransferase involved in cell wall biosynthesis
VAAAGDPRRVALVLHEDVLGGATVAALRAVGVLREEGLDVRVWCADPSPLAAHLRAEGWPVAGVPRLMRYSPAALRHPPGPAVRLASLPRMVGGFGRWLRAVAPDLVHANATLSLPEALMARALGVPTLFHVHDVVPGGRRGDLVRRAVWLAGDEVVGVSAASAATLHLGARRAGVVHEPGLVPEAPVRHRPAPGAPPVVASVGVIAPRKGTDVLLDAVALLRERGVRARVVLAGAVEDGPLEPWAREQLARAAALGIEHHDRVAVAEHLPGWDVFVLASRQDPFPLVVLEALGAAVPVVAAAAGGIPEQLDGGRAGILVPAEDPRALADAIARVLADPQRAAPLAAAGHARVAGAFTPRHAAAALAQAYRRTLAAAR